MTKPRSSDPSPQKKREPPLNEDPTGLTLVYNDGGSSFTVSEPTLPAILTNIAERLSTLSGSVTITAAGLQMPPAALADLTAPRPGPATVVVQKPGSGVVVLHHRVVGVDVYGSGLAGATGDLVGILRLNEEQIPAVAYAIAEISAEAAGDPVGSAFGWTTLAVTRAGPPVAVDDVAGWPIGDGAPTELTPGQVERIKLVRANRADDGAYSLLVLRRLSKPLTALAARRGWSPNSITIVSLFVGLLAAGLFATGQRWALVLGAVLLQVSLVIDCSDGEVARLTSQYSTIGAWLDASTDRVKEYLAYAGLAVGAASNGSDVWLLAVLTMILQTSRHLGDYNFNRVQVGIETKSAIAAMRSAGQTQVDYGSVLAASSALNRSWIFQFKKMIHLPIGERWLVISLSAALLTPHWTFVLLLSLGLLGLAYTSVGRVLRCRHWPNKTHQGEELVERQLDLGPLIRLVPGVDSASSHISGGRFGWAWPSLTTAAELGAWLAVAAILIPDWLPAAFAVVLVIAFHRYDILYRAMAGHGMPGWLTVAAWGVDGRLFYLGTIAVLGAASVNVLVNGYMFAAIWLGIFAVAIASIQWVRVNREA